MTDSQEAQCSALLVVIPKVATSFVELTLIFGIPRPCHVPCLAKRLGTDSAVGLSRSRVGTIWRVFRQRILYVPKGEISSLGSANWEIDSERIVLQLEQVAISLTEDVTILGPLCVG